MTSKDPKDSQWGEDTEAEDTPFGATDWTGETQAEKSKPSLDLPLKPGDILAGSYRLERVIGIGGMGVVFGASHTRLKLRHAVKLLFPKFSEHRDSFKRFRREAEICSELGHPNIVQMVDFNVHKGLPFIVMELLKGEDLEKRLQRDQKLELATAVEIFHQAAGALEAAHRRGIVHRDLKPQNIFLCRAQQGLQVKIVDFGISKVVGSALTALTQTEAVFGSPWYMSPEQARGQSAKVDRRTDVFAMGAILYQMLGGQPPFGQDCQVPAVLYRVVHESPTDLLELRPDLSPQIVQTVTKALSKDPSHRFQTMEEFDRELVAAASHDPKVTLLPDLVVGQPVHAPPVVGTPMTTPAGAYGTPWGQSTTVGFLRQILPWFLLAIGGIILVLVLISRSDVESPAPKRARIDVKAMLEQASNFTDKKQDLKALSLLSTIQLATTDPDQLEAASRLERVIRTRPQIARARKLLDARKHSAAIKVLNEVVALVPDHPEAKKLLEEAMASLNK